VFYVVAQNLGKRFSFGKSDKEEIESLESNGAESTNNVVTDAR
jgi:hypothetical protein